MLNVYMLFLVFCQNHLALTCKRGRSRNWRNFRKRQHTFRNLHLKCEVSVQQMLQEETHIMHAWNQIPNDHNLFVFRSSFHLKGSELV
jgi:hypothetical protein